MEKDRVTESYDWVSNEIQGGCLHSAVLSKCC